MKGANFSKVQNFHEMIYVFSSVNRLVAEFKNDEDKLATFNSYIKQVFPDGLKTLLKYQEKPNDIQFEVSKKIFVMTK